MHRDVKTIEPQASLIEAAQSMNEFRIGSLVVVDNKELVGIITERDIIRSIAEGKNPEETKVEDIMTKKVIVASPDITLEEAAEILTQHKIKKLPIVEGGMLVGIVTASDLIAYEEKLIEKLAILFILSPKVEISG
jgi:CBS domain-containing protein